ncbi:MAG: NAD-dependent epimerase/dehydratase family protein [Gemmatimonadota bacterium]
MTDRVAVTGATGFIGGHLVERLIAEGRRVRALARSFNRLPPGVRNCVDVVVGGLESRAAVGRTLHGADTVFHLAGLAAAWSPREDDYFATNVAGVRRLLGAARREGVRRVVHVSTVLTLLPHLRHATPYAASKLEGERRVQAYVASGGDAVIVHPCRVYGPGPLNDANGATRLIRTFAFGHLAVLLRDGGARGNYVHVDDVVDGLLLAANRGETGGSYVLGGENCSLAELFELVAELTGVRRPRLPVPRTAALTLAGVLEACGRLGAPVPITRAWVRSFFQDQAVDIAPTTAALGFHPRSLRVGLAETIAWLRQQKGGVPCEMPSAA